MAVNMLLSFAFYAKEDMGAYRASMPCGRLLIDSGAFTAASVGKPVDLAAYADFLKTWQHAYDHAVTLDVIGDPAGTRRNTRWLHNQGLNVMPVFTRGDSLTEFDAMVKDSGYVCVGGGVGMPQSVLVPRLRGLQRRAEELGGGIHALGVGNLTALRKIRPYSADASNVASVFRFGKLIAYDGRQLHIIAMADKRRMRQLAPLYKAQGIQLAQMITANRHPLGRERFHLMVRMGVSFLCADEDTTAFAVPVPHGVKDSVGTHLYSAATGSHLAPATAELDRLAHDPSWTVPLWTRYRDKHHRQCRALSTALQEGTTV